MKMARINLLQLGRVLLEAKPLVGHGNWADWVKSNTSMSVRTAEQYMQAYQQFGLDKEIAELGTSKILKLLPLPEEERKTLLDRDDIGAMSAREFDAAIKQAREEALEQGKAEALSDAKAAAEAEIRAQALSEARKTAQAESAKALKDARESWEHCLDAERADAEKRISDAEERVQDAEKRIEDMHRALKEAQKRAIEAENRESEPPQSLLDELSDAKERASESEHSAQHFAQLAQKLSSEKLSAEKARDALQADIDEQNELLKQQQEALNKAQEELLKLQSAQARGEAERGGDGISPEDFSAAVREFIGATCRLPQMQRVFAGMNTATRELYEENLRTIESWLNAVRQAMRSCIVEADVV